jgi:hypothetical protein
MKNFKNLFGILSLVLGILLWGGCSGIIGPEPPEAGESAGQTVTFLFNPGRTLLPGITGFDRYDLYLTPNSGQTGPLENPVELTGASNSVTLAPGSWTVTAKGMVHFTNTPGIADGYYEAAVSEPQSFNVGLSGSSMVTITIRGGITAGVKGLFSYAVSFPAEVISGALRIQDLDGEAISGLNPVDLTVPENRSGSIALNPGYYLLKVELENADHNHAYKTEVLHIYSSLTTTADSSTGYAFTAGNFAPMITLTGKLLLSNYGADEPDSASVTLYRTAGHINQIAAADLNLTTGSWSARISSFYQEVFVSAVVNYGETPWAKDLASPVPTATATEEDLTLDFRFFSVTQDSTVQHGSLSVSPSIAFSGTPVTIRPVPDLNYRYNSGTLAYNGTAVSDETKTFTMPAENVSVYAEFRTVIQNFSRGSGAGTVYYENFQELIDAAAGSAAEPDEFIVLENINWDSGYTIPADKHIALTVPAGAPKLVKRAGTYTGSLFTVSAGASLSLEGNTGAELLVDGGGGEGKTASGPLLTVSGVLTIKEGLVLQNNYNSSTGGAVGLNGAGSALNMEGGIIRSNSASYGGGVYVAADGLLDFSGGTIGGNNAAGQGNNMARQAGANAGAVEIGGTAAEGTYAAGPDLYYYNDSYYHIQAQITSFEVGTVTGIIDHANNTISANLPYDTDLSTLAPNITYTGASCTLTGPFSYVTPNSYMVSALDGLTVEYSVLLTKQALGTPGQPSITVNGNTLELDWTAVTFAGEYQVFYQQGNALAFDEDDFLSATVTGNEADITGLANGAYYTVYVRAKNGIDLGAISAGSTARTILPVPVNLDIVPGAGELVLEWDTVSGATSYEIYYSAETTPPAANTAASFSVSGGDTETAAISGLPHDVTRYVWIRAAIDSYKSIWSEAASGTTFKAVSDFSLNGLVIVPVKNTAPVINPINRTQYAGTFVWTDEEDNPETVLFEVSTVYKAILNLTAAATYTFTGADSFTYTGADSVVVSDNTGSTVTVTIRFPATEPADNSGGIGVGADPTVKLYKDGTALAEGGTSIIQSGTGTYTVSIEPDSYSSTAWYLNGNKVAENTNSITLTKRVKGNYLVTVEATPQGGTKNSGSHTFVVQ